MIPNDLSKKLEDKLALRATQILRRRLTRREQVNFFIRNQGNIINANKDFEKALDNIIKTYLKDIKK